LELYWYFDFKKPDSEEIELCREALIKRYEEKLNEITNNRKVTPTSKMELENAILMLIELYRRNGDFETAISHYKKYKSLSSPYAHKIMKEQVHLIKHKDENRH
jgi:DNA-binding SARP family transcriptional activator